MYLDNRATEKLPLSGTTSGPGLHQVFAAERTGRLRARGNESAGLVPGRLWCSHKETSVYLQFTYAGPDPSS